jgi:hypothetical protein
MSDALQPVVTLFFIIAVQHYFVSCKTLPLDVQHFCCSNKLLNVHWQPPFLTHMDTNISELLTSIFRIKDNGVKLYQQLPMKH